MAKKSTAKLVRLHKFMADCGVCSRRKAEEMIAQGLVQVNGEPVSEMGHKIDPLVDQVAVNGQILEKDHVQKIYLLLNKPRGYMTTVHDPEGRKTVMDLCQEFNERLYPVGRLDYLSEGLLIMTNDGELAHQIMHPRFNLEKVYEVKLFGVLSPALLAKLRQGAQLEDGFVKPHRVRILQMLANKTWIEMRIGEGKNREIRRLCEACGLTVDKLRRVAIGNISIEGIQVGHYKQVSQKELLRGLGLQKGGRPATTAPKTYQSPKKTLRPGKRERLGLTAANDKKFYKFRREYYFATLKARDKHPLSPKPEETKKLSSGTTKIVAPKSSKLGQASRSTKFKARGKAKKLNFAKGKRSSKGSRFKR